MHPAEIQSEPLQNLLTSLRQHVDATQTGSAATAGPPPMPTLPALNRGDVVEIQGPASSGKTHLLYHVLSTQLVPEPPLADVEIAAVVYDTDTSFDTRRFRHLLLSRISRLPSGGLDRQEIARRSLARLHIFRPTSLLQLAASIAHLPAYHSAHMPNQVIGVLAVDSISTFYWADRFSAEQLRNAERVTSIPRVLPLLHVLNAIHSLRLSHGPLTVLTNWALNPLPSPSASLYKQHLHPFPVIEDVMADLGANVSGLTDHHVSSSPFRLAHHITLSPPSSFPFPAYAPLDVALRQEALHRKEIIDKGQVLCLSRSSGTRHTVHFTFWITDDDILIQRPL